MASFIRCPNCGRTFSEEEYKNHSCDDSKTVGGAVDVGYGKFGQEEVVKDDTGER